MRKGVNLVARYIALILVMKLDKTHRQEGDDPEDPNHLLQPQDFNVILMTFPIVGSSSAAS
jgi:hypothetical protein